MFERLAAFLLSFIIFMNPLSVAWADTAPTLSAGTDAAAARREWEPLLKTMGVEEGRTTRPEDYALLIKKLSGLASLAENIRSSTTSPIPLSDWVHILTGLGIEPKSRMSEADWVAILAKAGVDVSKGVSAPLPNVSTRTANGFSPPPGLPTPMLPIALFGDAPPMPPQAAPTAPLVVRPNSNTITLDLRGMDVNEVLKLIARQGELNMITAPNVHGSVTLLLKDVELWEALRLVLETDELAYSYDGKVVRVMTEPDYERLYGVRFDDKTEFETIIPKNISAVTMSKFLEPLKSKVGKILVYESSDALVIIDTPDALKKMVRMAQTFDGQIVTRVFSLNYSKAKDILPKILPMTTKDVATVETDERTNRIVVMDYPDRIKPIETLIQAFDQQHRVVLIEAKIVQISLSNDYQLGVNWGAVFDKIGRNVGIPGGVTGNFAPFTIVAPGTPSGGSGTTGPGAAGPVGLTAAVGTLTQNSYTAVVQALQTVGKTKLISSPRISVINNETASLLVGTHQAYVTDTVVTPGTGATTTSEQINFIDVGVKLHVTPTIGEDGYITMKIKPEVSSVQSTLETAEGNAIPIVATSEVETSVLIKDGETLLLGGLIEDDSTKSDSGVPILSRIPLLGALFRSRSDSKTKSELAVFLTCHINTGRERVETASGEASMPNALVTIPR